MSHMATNKVKGELLLQQPLPPLCSCLFLWAIQEPKQHSKQRCTSSLSGSSLLMRSMSCRAVPDAFNNHIDYFIGICYCCRKAVDDLKYIVLNDHVYVCVERERVLLSISAPKIKRVCGYTRALIYCIKDNLIMCVTEHCACEWNFAAFISIMWNLRAVWRATFAGFFFLQEHL